MEVKGDIIFKTKLGYDMMPSGPELIAAESYLRTGGAKEKGVVKLFKRPSRKISVHHYRLPPFIKPLNPEWTEGSERTIGAYAMRIFCP